MLAWSLSCGQEAPGGRGQPLGVPSMAEGVRDCPRASGGQGGGRSAGPGRGPLGLASYLYSVGKSVGLSTTVSRVHSRKQNLTCRTTGVLQMTRQVRNHRSGQHPLLSSSDIQDSLRAISPQGCKRDPRTPDERAGLGSERSSLRGRVPQRWEGAETELRPPVSFPSHQPARLSRCRRVRPRRAGSESSVREAKVGAARAREEWGTGSRGGCAPRGSWGARAQTP